MTQVVKALNAESDHEFNAQSTWCKETPDYNSYPLTSTPVLWKEHTHNTYMHML